VLSAWNREAFDYHWEIAQEAPRTAPVLLSFGVHPQMPAAAMPDAFALFERLADEQKIDAVGECGFDLYDSRFRETEQIQEQLFKAQLAVACEKQLPVIIHARRAIHKLFPHTRALKKVPAVIFHSWAGTVADGEALLKRGINAFFSFGNTVFLNHKWTVRSASALPVERLLSETDAPYQGRRGCSSSCWHDLPLIIAEIGRLRTDQAVQSRIEKNFYKAFHGYDF
jgi:TatD DNase family protein